MNLATGHVNWGFSFLFCTTCGGGDDIPRSLPKVGALARGLEKGPLLKEESLGGRGVTDAMGLIVGRNQVSHNGSGLEQADIGVRVNDS